MLIAGETGFVGTESLRCGAMDLVEVHQTKAVGGRDDDVAMLEVAVGNPLRIQACDDIGPRVTECADLLPLFQTPPHEHFQRIAADPLHLEVWPGLPLDEDRVVRPVKTGENGARVRLEI